ncbi:MAG: hypothetical protein R2724_00565 [Bryobacterales bacterium]
MRILHNHRLLLLLGLVAFGILPALRAEPPAVVQNDLAVIGDRVEAFWKEIASVSCTETVEQWKIDPEKEKVLNQKKSTYDYLVFLQWVGDQLAVDESRAARGVAEQKEDP